MRKVIKAFMNVDLIVACIAFTILVLVTFTGVIARYFFNSPYTWQEEIQLFMIVWTIWYGGSAAFRYGGHVCVDIFVDMFPKGLQKVVDIAIYIISLALLFYIFKQGVAYVSQLAATHRVTQILHISKGLIYSCIPIASIIMIGGMSQAFYKTVLRKCKDGGAN
jgi:TRAP-type C4-dicarboxylate transport system permease small subunit